MTFFWRVGNLRLSLLFCSHFIAITIIIWHFKIFFYPKLHVFYSILYSICHHCIWLAYFALLGRGTGEFFLSWGIFCRNHNCLPFQNVPHLGFYIYYSRHVQCMSSWYWLDELAFLRRGRRGVVFFYFWPLWSVLWLYSDT